MQFFTIQHLSTVQHLPKLDSRIVGYGVLWTLAIGAGVTWLVA